MEKAPKNTRQNETKNKMVFYKNKKALRKKLKYKFPYAKMLKE